MIHHPYMTKQEISAGFKIGRRLVQEEWSHPKEIEAVEELIKEGIAVATPWEYKDNFQCARRIVSKK